MVVHKANANIESSGLDRLVDEFEEEEEEGSQSLFNSKSAAGEEPQLEMCPSLDVDEDSDTSPSLVDASASMKRQIQTELKEAGEIPSTQAISPRPTVMSDPSKSLFASTPSQFNQATPTKLPKVAPPGPVSATPPRVSKPIVIMDSDGDWTVGGQETPLFKSKSGKERKLKKPKQLELKSTFFRHPPSTSPTQQSSNPKVPKCDMATSVGGSGKTTSPLAGLTRSPLSGNSQDAASNLATPSATPINGSSLPSSPSKLPSVPGSPLVQQGASGSSHPAPAAAPLAVLGGGKQSFYYRDPALPSGWYIRVDRTKIGEHRYQVETSFFSPDGALLRSQSDVANYLGGRLQINQFKFHDPPVSVDQIPWRDDLIDTNKLFVPNLQNLANILGTAGNNSGSLSWGNANQGPVHLNTPRGIKVSPKLKDVKKAEGKKVRKDKLLPPTTDALHR
jgi:hypothetical protein